MIPRPTIAPCWPKTCRAVDVVSMALAAELVDPQCPLAERVISRAQVLSGAIARPRPGFAPVRAGRISTKPHRSRCRISRIAVIWDIISSASWTRLRPSNRNAKARTSCKPRQGRNPATGETITIAAAKKLTFTPSKAVRDSLNAASPGRGSGSSASVLSALVSRF